MSANYRPTTPIEDLPEDWQREVIRIRRENNRRRIQLREAREALAAVARAQH